MRYEAQLEQQIRRELNLVGPLTAVTVSDKDEFVVIQDGPKYVHRRLTELGRNLLHNGPTVSWATGELFLEPEEDDDSTAV